MSTQELKTEIQRLLDHVPDSVLHSLVDFLRQAQQQTNSETELVAHLKKILAEDKELLKKLAQ